MENTLKQLNPKVGDRINITYFNHDQNKHQMGHIPWKIKRIVKRGCVIEYGGHQGLIEWSRRARKHR